MMKFILIVLLTFNIAISAYQYGVYSYNYTRTIGDIKVFENRLLEPNDSFPIKELHESLFRAKIDNTHYEICRDEWLFKLSIDVIFSFLLLYHANKNNYIKLFKKDKD